MTPFCKPEFFLDDGGGRKTSFKMTSCKHNTLVLLPEKKNRLQCRHCHLTITAAELGDGYCPECFETHNEKRYDFEELKAEGSGPARYRCETCGAIIESE